jgi:hypothetical protein
MVDARQEALAAHQLLDVRQRGGVEQVEIRHVGQQAAMQHIVIRQPIDRAHPDVLQRRRVLRLHRVAALHHAEFERPRGLVQAAGLLRHRLERGFRHRVGFRQRFRRRHVGHAIWCSTPGCDTWNDADM